MALIKRGNIWHVDICWTDPLTREERRVRETTKTGDRKLAGVVHGEIQAALYRGTYLASKSGAVGGTLTIAKAFDRWTEVGLSGRAEGTLIQANSQLAALINANLLKLKDPVTVLTENRMDEIIAATRKNGASPTTIKSRIWFFKGVVRAALKLKAIRSEPDYPNPGRPDRSRKTRMQSKIFSMMDESRALEYLGSDDRYMALRDYIVVALDTGCRLAEILTINSGSFEGRHLVVTGKGSKARSVPVTTRARTVLYRRLEENNGALYPPVPKRNSDYWRGHLQGSWHEARTDLGLRHLSLHSCRHTFGSRMAAAGVSLKRLQDLMGHESLSTTEVYLSVIEPSLDNDASALENFNLKLKTQS